MDVTTIIGLGLVALYLVKRTDKVQQTLETKILENEENDLKREDDFMNKFTEQQPVNLAEKFLTITPNFYVREMDAKNWSGKFSWTVKNTSSDKVFYIRGIRSEFAVDGVGSSYQPYLDNLNYRLAPGKTQEIYIADNNARWFADSAERGKVKKILGNIRTKGNNPDYKSGYLIANAQLLITGDFFKTEIVANFRDLKGGLAHSYGGLRYFNQYGGNGLNKDKWQ